MSANNQTLIKEHKGKWYVFVNVNAESWHKKNTLEIKSAAAVCDTKNEAYDRALELDEQWGQFGGGTEYGIQFNRLCKDDAEVILKD